MSYYQRTLKRSFTEASEQFPVVILTGPRQIGKTTFLQHICEKDRKYVTLDDPMLRKLANEEPLLFLQKFSAPVLIDEIQYAPGLLPYIKMEADKKKLPGMFWLTGSQQFQLMRGISETLAGRAAIMNMLGFSGREKYKLNLDVSGFLPTKDMLEIRNKSCRETNINEIYKDIWLGSFPALIAGPAKDWALFYSSYLQTYLQRDIRDLTKVGDETAFLRFLKACAVRTGQLLNISELARDADISVNTAKAWLSILGASFQIYLLQPYHSNLTKRLVKRPKLYFLDTGLCSYLAEWSSAQTLEAGAMSGAILETYVFSEIIKSWWYCGKTPSIYYCRDRDNKEIDILFVHDQKLYGVEVKKSSSPKSDWAGGFSILKKLKLSAQSFGIVCLADKILPIGNEIYVIPVGLL